MLLNCYPRPRLSPARTIINTMSYRRIFFSCRLFLLAQGSSTLQGMESVHAVGHPEGLRTGKFPRSPLLRWSLGMLPFLCFWVGLSAEPIRLTYWNWAPNIEQVVEIWNKKNPDIQVTISRAAGPMEIVPKLIAADRAGTPPDITNVTYQDLPALVVNGLVSDITRAMEPNKSKISPVAWSLVNLGGAVWAAPQGTSPMMFYYREDLFKQFGLEVPTTWEDFAVVAKKLHAADPSRHLATFPTADPGLFVALTHQAGGNWWTLEGDTWTVSIASASNKRIAEFWGELIATGAIATSQVWSPEWSASMAEGRLLGFISAVWAPPLIKNIAPATLGKWNAAPLPRWREGAGTKWASGVMGGSAATVTAKSKNKEAATKFILWITSDPEALEAYVRLANIWPAWLPAREMPTLQHAPTFIPQRTDFYALATAIDQETPTVSWGPNVSTSFDAFRNAFATAVKKKSGFSEALEIVQRTTVRDMKSQGYQVKEAR